LNVPYDSFNSFNRNELSQVTLGYIELKHLKNLSGSPTEFPSLLRKVAAFVLTMALFGFALMFSMLLVAVVLTAGALAWGYLWWKTRELRKQIRMHSSGDIVNETKVIEGEVIEGEVIRVDSDDVR